MFGPGGMPNIGNVSTDQLKNSMGQINNMSDAQIQQQIDMMKGINPMFANMTVAQMRAMSGQMNGMSDAQLNAQKEQAARMQASGQMPGMPGMGGAPPQANAQPSAPELPAEAKQDFEEAKLLKENAAKDFKAKDYNSACDKYYKVISVVRSNEKLKSTSQGKDICTTSRLNIALCKFTTKQYDEAIDQCERVLDTEPKNWKASFRLASSLFQRSNENSSETELKTICNYAKKALDGNPNDAKVKEFYT